MLLLQGPTSRSKSVRQHLSSMCWVRGVYAFFESEVPFSFSNGDYMADWIIALGDRLGLHRRDFKIKEYGAGLGVLALQLITRLQDLKGDSGWQFTVSEYAAQSIEQLKQSTPLGRHSQVKFCVEDVTCPAQTGDRFDLIILNYLIDSLPTDQLVWKEGHFSEILATTLIDSRRPIIDSVHFPPRFVMEDELVEWIKSLSLVEASFMAPAISSRLQETFELGAVTSVSEKELELIREFLTDSQISDISFNYPLGLTALLDRVWDELSDDGAVWIFDMADIDPSFYSDYSALTVAFRGVICFPLWVDFLTWYWNKKNGVGTASKRRDGRPVGIVLTKKPVVTSDELTLAFDARLVDFGNELEIGLNLVTIDSPNWEEKLTSLEASIPQELRSDYHVCMHFALKWSQIGRPGKTLDWLAPLFRRYRDLAIAAKTLAARAYKQLGNMSEAGHYLLDVVTVAPDCAYAYKELSLLALKDQNWGAFKQFATQSVQHGTQDLPWNLMLSIALLDLQDGLRDDADKLLTHLETQINLWPQGFETGFRERVEAARGLLAQNSPISL